MRGLALLALLLAGCAVPPATMTARAPVLPPVPPKRLQDCPPAVPAPHPPPAPRTIGELLDWAIGTSRALSATEAARDECLSRLTQLNEWIVDHTPPAEARP